MKGLSIHKRKMSPAPGGGQKKALPEGERVKTTGLGNTKT